MAEVAGQQVRYGQINREYGMKMFTMPPEEDGPIWMVNLMSYREKADYADGREADYSGKEADDKYAPLGPLKAIGADIGQIQRLGSDWSLFFRDCDGDRKSVV